MTDTITEAKLEPDPLWDALPGPRELDDLEREQFTGSGHCGADSWDEADYVGEAGRWNCSRGQHPDHWRHAALSGRLLIGTWGGIDPVDLAAEEGEVDPDPEPFEPVVGTLYKFKSRSTLLLMVGSRRGGQVEVLDLTHQHYRLLPREKLVPRKPDAPPPTAEQIAWMATFMASQRETTRRVAVDQRRNDYFKSTADLNRVLRELELEPYTPRRVGTITPQVQVSYQGLDDGEARRRIAEWFNTLTPPPGVQFTRTLRENLVQLSVYDQD